jgi:hypothetical protein
VAPVNGRAVKGYVKYLDAKCRVTKQSLANITDCFKALINQKPPVVLIGKKRCLTVSDMSSTLFAPPGSKAVLNLPKTFFIVISDKKQCVMQIARAIPIAVISGKTRL